MYSRCGFTCYGPDILLLLLTVLIDSPSKKKLDMLLLALCSMVWFGFTYYFLTRTRFSVYIVTDHLLLC